MIKLRMGAAVLAASLVLGWTAPGAAQELPMTYGDYWEVTGVSVEDGAEAQYIDYLATEWKKSQEFAKSKGWIKGYHVLDNLYPRNGEPDLYLVTVFSHIADAKESAARDKAFEEFMQKDVRRMNAESGTRAKYRRVQGSELFGELLLK